MLSKEAPATIASHVTEEWFDPKSLDRLRLNHSEDEVGKYAHLAQHLHALIPVLESGRCKHLVPVFGFAAHENLEVAGPYASNLLHITYERIPDAQALDHCLIKDGELPNDRELMLRLFEYVAEALHHLHVSGWVHRDVKPSNFFARIERGVIVELWLGDHEITLPIHSLGAPRTMILPMGTESFAPPEQFSASFQPTPASDIYALGISIALLLHPDPNFIKRLHLYLRETTGFSLKDKINIGCSDYEFTYPNCGLRQSYLDMLAAVYNAQLVEVLRRATIGVQDLRYQDVPTFMQALRLALLTDKRV